MNDLRSCILKGYWTLSPVDTDTALAMTSDSYDRDEIMAWIEDHELVRLDAHLELEEAW